MASGCPAAYRKRNPRATPLYRLVEAHFDKVKGQWEERFERRCGFWRSFIDGKGGGHAFVLPHPHRISKDALA